MEYKTFDLLNHYDNNVYAIRLDHMHEKTFNNGILQIILR